MQKGTDMTIEEAIKDIKENIQPSVGGKSLEMAIEALEKQMPYKIVNRGDENEKYGHCKCGAFAVDIHKYCPKCGQSIDWSVEDVN